MAWGSGALDGRRKRIMNARRMQHCCCCCCCAAKLASRGEENLLHHLRLYRSLESLENSRRDQRLFTALVDGRGMVGSAALRGVGRSCSSAGESSGI